MKICQLIFIAVGNAECVFKHSLNQAEQGVRKVDPTRGQDLLSRHRIIKDFY